MSSKTRNRLARAAAALLLAALASLLAAQTAPAPSVPTPAPAGFGQARALEDLRRQIAGKEETPAEQVFQNVQMFKGAPAARLLRVMETGFSRSLGVDCAYCHVPGQWHLDDKPPKKTAREMMIMARAITGDYLKKIKTIENPNPAVNCTTCHRGQIKPALDLP